VTVVATEPAPAARRRWMITPTAYRVAPASLEHTDRAEWLRLRRAGIGGSDIAPVMGLADYGRTAWQVYLDKTGALPLDDRDENAGRAEELTWWGHQMEAVAARRFRMLTPGVRMTRVGMLAHAEHPWMRVNLDRLVTGCPLGSPCLWECKNRNAYASADWDRDGDPENVPDGPALQTHWGLIITGYGHGHLSAVIGGNELRSYVVEANPELHATMTAEASWFWNECVLAGVAPPIDAAERTGRILARLWEADPDAVMVAGPEIEAKWAELHAANADAAEAVRVVDQLRHELAAWLGSAEVCLDAAGNKLFTWRQNGPFRSGDFRDNIDPATWAKYARMAEAVDTRALAAADPALYRAWRARTFRVYSLPKPRTTKDGAR
jgi:putative phage-type endonuclease